MRSGSALGVKKRANARAAATQHAVRQRAGRQGQECARNLLEECVGHATEQDRIDQRVHARTAVASETASRREREDGSANAHSRFQSMRVT
eukprot:3590133-Pleurochrysis_carterae.AAC.1